MLKRIDWVITLHDFIHQQTKTNKKEVKKLMLICSFANDHYEFVYFYQETWEKIYTSQFLTDCKNILQHLCFLNELLMSNVFELTIKNRFQFSATKRTTQQCVHSENEFLFARVQNHGISLIFFLFISTFYLVLRNFDYYSNILYYTPVTYSRPTKAVKLYCALTFSLQWRVAEFILF